MTLPPSEIEKAYTTLAIRKATRMAERTSYAVYIDEVLHEFGIDDPRRSFLLGAIDGMLYELSATIGQTYMKPQLRKRVLRQIMTAIGL